MAKRNPDDLIASMASQLRFIRNSAASYDRGDLEEARRISTAIAILIDTRRDDNPSLLRLLDLEKHIPLLSTGNPLMKGNLIGSSSLTEVQWTKDGRVRHVPIIYTDDVQQINGFEFVNSWLDGVIMAQGDECINRRKLLREMRDTDGGAHVDAKRKGFYRRVVENNLASVYVDDNPVRNIELAAMRQLAYEIETSLIYPYACRVNAKRQFVINFDTIAVKKQSWLIPSVVFVRNEDFMINFVFKNYGFQYGQAFTTVSAAVTDSPSLPEEFLKLDKATLKLEPDEKEAICTALRGISSEDMEQLAIGRRCLHIKVNVQYQSGVARPSEEHYFRYNVNNYEGVANRIMPFAKIKFYDYELE